MTIYRGAGSSGVGAIADLVAYSDLASTSDAALGDYLIGFKQSDSTGVLSNAVARTLHGKLQESVSVQDFDGCDPTGATDSTAAFNYLTAYLRSRYVSSTPSYAYVEVVIPPGRYSISSWDLTAMNMVNIHVRAYGAVLIANTAGKNVVDGLGTLGLKIFGLGVYSASATLARSGLQLGYATDAATCGINNLFDVKIWGYYDKAPFMNLGSEASNYFGCRFLQYNTDTTAYALICDGNGTYLPTTDYATNTRTATGKSFTINKFYGCHMQNHGGGAAVYLGRTGGWEFDQNCYYYTSGSKPAFVVYGTSSDKHGQLTIKGSFEGTSSTYAVQFTGNSTNWNISGFSFECSNLYVATSVLGYTDTATFSLQDADIKIHAMSGSATATFASSGTFKIDGRIMSQNASKLNLGTLSAFNGVVHTNDYTALASVPAAGAYSIYDNTNSKAYHGGEHTFPTATGTFTPTFTFATPGDLSVAYTSQHGSYIKLGKLVYFQLALSCTPTFSTASGNIRIAGLPVATQNVALESHSFPVSYSSVNFVWPSSATQLMAKAAQGATYMELFGMKSGATSANLTTASVTSGVACTLFISGAYIANS